MRPSVTAPATGTIGTPPILNLLAADDAHSSGLRHGKMMTAIALTP